MREAFTLLDPRQLAADFFTTEVPDEDFRGEEVGEAGLFGADLADLDQPENLGPEHVCSFCSGRFDRNLWHRIQFSAGLVHAPT